MDGRRDSLPASRLPLPKRLLDEPRLQTLRCRPPDDEPRVQIKQDNQIQPPFLSPDLGDVRSPDLVRACRCELSGQHALGNR